MKETAKLYLSVVTKDGKYVAIGLLEFIKDKDGHLTSRIRKSEIGFDDILNYKLNGVDIETKYLDITNDSANIKLNDRKYQEIRYDGRLQQDPPAHPLTHKVIFGG